MNNISLLMLTILAAAALCACETIKGVGRDVTNAGEAIDRTF